MCLLLQLPSRKRMLLHLHCFRLHHLLHRCIPHPPPKEEGDPVRFGRCLQVMAKTYLTSSPRAVPTTANARGQEEDALRNRNACWRKYWLLRKKRSPAIELHDKPRRFSLLQDVRKSRMQLHLKSSLIFDPSFFVYPFCEVLLSSLVSTSLDRKRLAATDSSFV